MKKSILCFLLCLSLTFSLVTIIIATNYEASDVSVTLKDKKVYSNVSIDDDFVNDRVIVVMDGNVGAINKVHSKSFFGTAGISNITDLTQIDLKKVSTQDSRSTSDSTVSAEQTAMQINTETFRQILLIDLNEKSKENVIKTIKQLEKIDGIVYAGPDYACGTPGSVPNDTHYSSQWALNTIDIESAWNITTGSAKVRVGVMDTGIASHVDLNGNVVTGWDFFNENSTTSDEDASGHGTHVAGIIGAITNNAKGIAGVSRNVSIVPLQIQNKDGDSDVSDIIQAISYATNNNIQIINHS